MKMLKVLKTILSIWKCWLRGVIDTAQTGFFYHLPYWLQLAWGKGPDCWKSRYLQINSWNYPWYTQQTKQNPSKKEKCWIVFIKLNYIYSLYIFLIKFFITFLAYFDFKFSLVIFEYALITFSWPNYMLCLI